MTVDPERVKHGLWWDRAWTLVEGCTAVSAGCRNCWAKAMHQRFRGKTFGNVTPREDRLEIPLKRRIPTVYAVWNDLFHAQVSTAFIERALGVMEKAKQHRFIVLTKRAPKMYDYFQPCMHRKSRASLPNVVFGVSVEDRTIARDRSWFIEHTQVAHHVLSYEPVLGPIDGAVDYGALDWLIIGPETGQRRRPCEIQWMRDAVVQAQRAGVAVFVKAIEINGRISKDMDEWPEDLRLRQFPEAILGR